MRYLNVIPHYFLAKHLLLAGVFCMPVVCLATEKVPTEATSIYQSGVSAAQWTTPRSGETVATLPGLLAVMQQVVQHSDQNVVLHYPESENGEKWVAEVRDWLVSLGLASNRIQSIPGSVGDMIKVTQVAAVPNPTNKQNTMAAPPSSTSSIRAEPFHIKEAVEGGNGVEIP